MKIFVVNYTAKDLSVCPMKVPVVTPHVSAAKDRIWHTAFKPLLAFIINCVMGEIPAKRHINKCAGKLPGFGRDHMYFASLDGAKRD
jgi:hypothetical protein